ncbi:Uncharacterised protein [Mycobacteroides abscessus subsp. abscessus]|nr:Uncharacterised protein [Mycobacteroides abscessus subsp. abscessus]
MFGQPCGDRAGLQRLAGQLEALVHLGFDRFQGFEQPVAQNPELEVVEQPVNLVPIPRRQRQLGGRIGQRHRPHQIGQFAVQDHRSEVGAQRIPHLSAHGIGLVHQLLE